MTERIWRGTLRPVTVPEIEAYKDSDDIWLDDGGLVSDETSELVLPRTIYRRAHRDLPEDNEFNGHTTNKLNLGRIPNAYHTTDVPKAIRESGLILSVFYPDEQFEGGYEPSQNWHLDPSYSIHFPAEKSAKSLRNGGEPVELVDLSGEPRFRMFMTIPDSVRNMVLARVKGKHSEYVSSRKMTKSTDELREDGFGFLAEDVEVTGVPGREFLADIPITELIQKATIGFSFDAVFGHNEAELATEIHDCLKEYNEVYPVQFYNGHGDRDGLRTISLLWAHTTMRSYWERYGHGVVSMIMDTENDKWVAEHLDVNQDELMRTKSVVWNKFMHQFKDPALQLSWYQQQSFMKSQGFVLSEEEVSKGEVDDWFSEEKNVEGLIRLLSAVNPENNLRYLRSDGESGYSPFIPPGMLASVVDFNSLKVDEVTRMIDWGKMNRSLSLREQLIVYADSYDWDAKISRFKGRFQPIRSRNYAWYRENWVDHYDDV